MPKRGLKSLLKRTAPGKLGTFKGHACFRDRDRKAYRGITKLLATKLYSSGFLPDEAIKGGFRGGFWRGKKGGRRRGSAVDSQVSRLANSSDKVRKSARKLQLTATVLTALKHHGMTMIAGQRVVLDASRGVATAIDVVCQRGDDELVLIELKTGYAGDRKAAALRGGRQCFLSSPCSRAKDSLVNRHQAQAAVGLALFKNETHTQDQLAELGIVHVTAGVLYANESGSDLHMLSEYWSKRGAGIVRSIA